MCPNDFYPVFIFTNYIYKISLSGKNEWAISCWSSIISCARLLCCWVLLAAIQTVSQAQALFQKVLNRRPKIVDRRPVTPQKNGGVYLYVARASSCKMVVGAAVRAFFRALLVQVKGFIIQIHSTNGKGGQFSDPDTLKSFCQKQSCFLTIL